MKDYFIKLKNQLVSIWQNFSKKQKIIFISVTALFICFIIILFLYSTSIRFTSLFGHKLNIKESGEITGLLSDWGYKFKFADNRILVPISQKDDILLRLGREDKLPKESGRGFEIFDNVKFGRTEYEKKVNFQRAVEGELQRMIEDLEPIEEAKVGIIIPESKLFITEEQPPKASITLKLKPFVKLSTQQIKGIINLAAYYVPKLTEENIWITDSAGNPLSDFLDEEKMIETKLEKQMKLSQRYEKDFKRKILAQIGKAIGFDKVRAEVEVEMNFDHLESQSEEFSNPGFDPIKVSEETLKEEFEGLGSHIKGRPGVDENIPLYKGAEKYPIKYKKDQATSNFQPNKKSIKTVKNPAITRVTASVMIDGTWDIVDRTKESMPPKRTYKNRTEEEKRRIEDLVKKAIGFNEARGDKVTVKELKFDRTEEFKQMDEAFMAKLQRDRMMRMSILATAVLVLLFITLSELRRRYKLRQEELLRKRELAAREAALGKELVFERELTAEEKERLQVLKNIQDTAKKDPEMLAALIKTWLMEE